MKKEKEEAAESVYRERLLAWSAACFKAADKGVVVRTFLRIDHHRSVIGHGLETMGIRWSVLGGAMGRNNLWVYGVKSFDHQDEWAEERELDGLLMKHYGLNRPELFDLHIISEEGTLAEAGENLSIMAHTLRKAA